MDGVIALQACRSREGTRLTYTEQPQRIANQYAESGEPWPATTHQISAWAIRKKLWAPQPSSLIGRYADELARAMRFN